MNRMNSENAERLMALQRKEAMKNAKKDAANNPINSYTHGFADGYSKGFIAAIELLMRNEEIWKEISDGNNTP